MATYNGAKYIEKQIDSILPQISEEDELVVVDDCSSDNTVTLIRQIGDARIRLFQNKANLGIIKNFEQSINISRGDIILLSDQDDIWMPNKISEILSIFNRKDNITLVVTDSQIIDHNDRIIANSYYQTRGGFVHGVIPHLIKPRFHGCTLAFKREMLIYFLPFPMDIPMHDMWIGIVNEIYGKTYYIKQPLVQYRRYFNNSSPSSRTSLSTMIKFRYSLVKNLLLLTIRKNIEKLL